MSSTVSTSPLRHELIMVVLITTATLFFSAHSSSPSTCGFDSIFSFGDSLADTGNMALSKGNMPFLPNRPPYGMTYFRRPTGRCSNGRLIIDFVAQALGVPLLPPYLGGQKGLVGFQAGVNFAVAGAVALDRSFFEERGIRMGWTNTSLSNEIGWFRSLLPSLCPDFSPAGAGCEGLSRSLFILGEIGGNDYNYPLLHGKNLNEIKQFIPIIINTISSAVQSLIEVGARTVMVPGNLPIGCSSAYLTHFQSSDKDDYDPSTGCLKTLNRFSEMHNEMLQVELAHLRRAYPHAAIIYADYYHAAMRLYRSPDGFGFSSPLVACCGGGGPYNYKASSECGSAGATACDDPARYVSWDGMHLTEAAYRAITAGLLRGPYTIPAFNRLCPNFGEEALDQFI